MLGETDSKDGGFSFVFLLNLEVLHTNRILFKCKYTVGGLSCLPSTFQSSILKQYSVRCRKAILKNKKIFEPSYKKVH